MTVNWKVLAEVGVPLRIPELLRVKPVGSVPVSVNESVPVPPLAFVVSVLIELGGGSVRIASAVNQN